jgi:hypothetical protein
MATRLSRCVETQVRATFTFRVNPDFCFDAATNRGELASALRQLADEVDRAAGPLDAYFVTGPVTIEYVEDDAHGVHELIATLPLNVDSGDGCDDPE